jgi:hypothetical protein
MVMAVSQFGARPGRDQLIVNGPLLKSLMPLQMILTLYPVPLAASFPAP